MAKTFFRTLLFLLLILGILGFGGGYLLHEPLPKGTLGPPADSLAFRMESALGKQGWDTLRWITWTFPEDRTYVWDRERRLFQLEWGGKRILSGENAAAKGMAWQEGQRVMGKTEERFLKMAREMFRNDMFQFVAPLYMTKPGVRKEIVPLSAKSSALLVTYPGHGKEKGETHLWEIDEQSGLPVSQKRWTRQFPVGGLTWQWQEWQIVASSIRVASLRKLGPITLRYRKIRGGQHWRDGGLREDPFEALESSR